MAVDVKYKIVSDILRKLNKFLYRHDNCSVSSPDIPKSYISYLNITNPPIQVEYCEDLKCDKVIIDDVGGAFKATEHLIEIGCKKIALLTTQDYVSVGALRKEGYLKALVANGVTIDESLIYKIDDSKNLYDQIELLINASNSPDAILAVNEIYAANALKVAKERGLEIPNDIAIIGFTSGLISEFTSPPLTSVVQHGFLMGQHAAELLINRIEHTAPEEFQKEVISTNLKVRKSTIKN